MGLFSSRYEYFAYAASSSMFEEDGRPDNHKQAILESSLRGLIDIPESIQLSIQTDYFARARAMMRYASREENGYVRGFPSATLIRIEVPEEAIRDAIFRDRGHEVDVIVKNDYGGFLDEKFFINHELQKYWLPQNDGDINDNLFEWEEGKPPDKDIWCPTDSTIQIPIVGPDGNYLTAENPYFEFLRASDNTDIWDPQEPGLNPNPNQPFPSPGNPPPPGGAGIPEQFNYIYAVRWNYEDPSTGDTEVFEIRVNLLKFWQRYSEIDDGIILRVIYTLEGDPCPRYWTYLVGSGEDPELEKLIQRIIRDARYLPVAVLQQDKVWFDEQPGSELEVSTNKLLKRLNLDGTEIKEDFLEQEEEDNASGDANRVDAEKWDFFIHVAVPIRCVEQGSKQYLFYFFEEMASFQRWSRDKYQEYLEKRPEQDPDSPFSMVQPISELSIEEGFENGYSVTYGWSYIDIKDEPGRFGIRDKITGEIREARKGEVIVEILERNNPDTLERYEEIIERMHGPDALIGPETEDPERDGYHDFVYITLQEYTEEGGWLQRRLIVMGISMAYKINTSTEAGEGYRFRYAVPELFGTEEETKEFRIPVSFSAVKKVSTVKREDVITEGLSATVFLVRVEKVSWYQRGFFKWLVVIIAVILLVVAVFFPQTIIAAAKLLSAAVGISSAVAMSLISFAIGFVTAYAGALIGGTAGQIFALLGAIVSMGTGSLTSAGWSGVFQKTIANAFNSWGSALSFIGTVSNIATSAMQVVQQYQFENLMDDFENFLEDARDKQQKLDEAWLALGDMSSGIDPLSLTQVIQSAPAETPEQFYARTINLNPGLLGYDAIAQFTDMATTPPRDPRDRDVIQGQFEVMARQRGNV